uniref:Uncharacterized protein n=1 Tax=Anguilla anguilla TaxID=7936 RepID=A0A0E9SJ13_ANGAN
MILNKFPGHLELIVPLMQL